MPAGSSRSGSAERAGGDVEIVQECEQQTQGAEADSQDVRVAVQATDLVTEDGVRAWLRSSPFITVLPPKTAVEADVFLLLANEVSESVWSVLRRRPSTAAHGLRPVVLVADTITERELIAAVDLGLVGFFVRDTARLPDIAQALVRAREGRAHLSGSLVGRLLREMRERRQSPLGVTERTGLHTREIEVLRMLSEGMDTSAIAVRLNYSERTIKGIIHEMVKRLGVQNRTQAVAYAIRMGAL
ncbi:LuxR C-terminal-related transcriptional regulator [Streptomyces sp. NPDC087659]|uniref:helix-turn-helix transcriptional regulator n=1 Tax=Streptomyces sp. NPDC087659 TaxID=3365801 RepID=UPI00380EE8C3